MSYTMLNIMNLKKILVQNINALRRENPGLSSHKQIARAAALHGHIVSSRSIGTLLQEGNPAPPTLATLDAVAHAFNVPAWMLLTADFDALRRTGGKLPTREALDLLQIISDSPALRQLLIPKAATDIPAPIDGSIPIALYAAKIKKT